MTKASKKDMIIEAASRMFAKKGFHQAKMDEIAVMAGVAKGTLYYNFSSKSKLFAATVTQGLNRIMDEIQEDLESDLPFMDHLHSLISNMIRLYISHSEVTRIYVNEMSSGIDDDVRMEIQDVRKKFIQFIQDILETGKAKGYLKPLSCHLSALAVVGIIDALCTSHLESSPDNTEAVSVDKTIDTVFTILSTGLVASEQGQIQED